MLNICDNSVCFSSCDLYSKNDEKPDIEELKPYYQSLVDQYIPGNVKW